LLLAAPQDGRSATGALGAVEGSVLLASEPSQIVRGATVSLLGPDPKVVLSDVEGRFRFEGVQPGRYIATAEKPGFLLTQNGAAAPGGPGVSFVVAAGSTVRVDVRVFKSAAIAGTVVDDFGKGLAGVTVTVLRRRQTQFGTSFDKVGEPVISDTTGRYRAWGLPPGAYVVAATPALSMMGGLRDSASGSGGSAPARITFVPTFHPSATSADAAAVVSLAAGLDLGGVDVRMSPVHVGDLTIQVTSAGTIDLTTVQVTLTPVPNYLETSALGIGRSLGGFATARLNAAGSFVIQDVPAGRYRLVARTPSASAAGSTQPQAESTRLLWAESELSVGPRSENLALSLAPIGVVSGKVVVPAGEELGDISVRLSSNSPDARAFVGRAGPTGEFAIPNVPPGRYRLDTVSKWQVASVIAGGVDVSDRLLEFPSDQRPSLSVTLARSLSSLTGTLQPSPPRAASDYAVVVFPAERELWMAPRRTRVVRPGADGGFDVLELPAGTYLVAATSDISLEGVPDPVIFEGLAAMSIAIELQAGRIQRLDLRAIR